MPNAVQDIIDHFQLQTMPCCASPMPKMSRDKDAIAARMVSDVSDNLISKADTAKPALPMFSSMPSVFGALYRVIQCLSGSTLWRA